MLPCNEVRELAEEYVSGTLDPSRRQQVARHARLCQSCHRFLEEARLAHRVLHQAAPPPAPPRLADRIKIAACTRLTLRPRPLHERALGSPAFLAVCASLLCGGIMCLLGIVRVGSVEPRLDAPAPNVEVVARFKLPVRDLAAMTDPQSARLSHERHAERGAEAKAPSLASVAASVASGLTTAAPRPASRPPLASFSGPTAGPSMSAAPTLPTPAVAPAGARTSRPDMAQAMAPAAPVPIIVPAAHDDDDVLEFDDLAAPGPPTRGDLTSTR